MVAPTRKSTRVTVAPVLAVEVAVRGTVELNPTDAPLAGAVSDMLGAEAVTVTLTAEEVAVAVLESVTRAVIENAPAVVVVQFTA